MIDKADMFKEKLRGYLLYSIAADSAPFVTLYLDSEPVRIADLSAERDTCWLQVPRATLSGTRDVGASLSMVIGDTEISLRREENYFPRHPLLYVYDRRQPVVGNTAGASMELDGALLPTTVPPDIDRIDATSVLRRVRTEGVVVLNWTPDTSPGGGRPVSARVEARGDTPSDPSVVIVCRLLDDGEAYIDLSRHLPRGWNRYELRLGRVTSEVVQHPTLGAMVVSPERIYSYSDDLRE